MVSVLYNRKEYKSLVKGQTDSQDSIHTDTDSGIYNRQVPDWPETIIYSPTKDTRKEV